MRSASAPLGTPVQQLRHRHILVFEVAGKRLGLEAEEVLEVQRAVAVSPLPTAPDGIEGVVDMRGRLVPVVDVRERFGLPRRPICLEDHFVIVSDAGAPVALRVDRALELREAGPEAEEASTGLAGVLMMDDGPVAVGGLGHLLAPLREFRDAVAR